MAEPTAGTLPPGGSEEIDLTVTAEALETGDFVASLDLRSNDPASPLLSHPVVLHARQVEASRAKFVPQALNLDSRGRRAFFDLRFQTELDLSEIALETVRLLDLVPPESVESLQGNDGVTWIRFMFDRAVVASHLARGENVEVFVRGEIPGKTWFIGSDTIRVVSTAQRDPLGRSNEPTGSLNVPSRTRGQLRDVRRTRLAESDHGD